MPRKPLTEDQKLQPLQISLPPRQIARVKEIAGPGRSAEWIRAAVGAALAANAAPTAEHAGEAAGEVVAHIRADLQGRLAALSRAIAAASDEARNRDATILTGVADGMAHIERLVSINTRATFRLFELLQLEDPEMQSMRNAFESIRTPSRI